jgi:putative multiple sugar transport system ATP-binding protein
MCDRIYVMSEGKIAGELDREEASQEIIMKYIINLQREVK